MEQHKIIFSIFPTFIINADRQLARKHFMWFNFNWTTFQISFLTQRATPKRPNQQVQLRLQLSLTSS